MTNITSHTYIPKSVAFSSLSVDLFSLVSEFLRPRKWRISGLVKNRSAALTSAASTSTSSSLDVVVVDELSSPESEMGIDDVLDALDDVLDDIEDVE